MSVNLVWVTPEAEKAIMYCARVSSPHRQDSEDSRLLTYCIKNKHWSPFEMASMCLEINTTRAISPQILRHRSFHFQEFSQRYSPVSNKPIVPRMRIAAKTNRQGSVDAELSVNQIAIAEKASTLVSLLWKAYTELVDSGISTESARNILPMCVDTRLYMSGTMRDWLHYVAVRTSEDTQQEHRAIAMGVQDILKKEIPVTWDAFTRYHMDKSGV